MFIFDWRVLKIDRIKKIMTVEFAAIPRAIVDQAFGAARSQNFVVGRIALEEAGDLDFRRSIQTLARKKRHISDFIRYFLFTFFIIITIMLFKIDEQKREIDRVGAEISTIHDEVNKYVILQEKNTQASEIGPDSSI